MDSRSLSPVVPVERDSIFLFLDGCDVHRAFDPCLPRFPVPWLYTGSGVREEGGRPTSALLGRELFGTPRKGVRRWRVLLLRAPEPRHGPSSGSNERAVHWIRFGWVGLSGDLSRSHTHSEILMTASNREHSPTVVRTRSRPPRD